MRRSGQFGTTLVLGCCNEVVQNTPREPTEAEWEAYALAWLGERGWEHLPGASVAPRAGADRLERPGWDELVLVDRLRAAIERINPGLPPPAIDDAVAQIRRLQEMTDGGFGSYLIMGNEWASHAATRRSVELFAEYVMPVFHDDATSRLRESEQWCRERRGDLFARQSQALDQAAARHQAKRDATRASVAS